MYLHSCVLPIRFQRYLRITGFILAGASFNHSQDLDGHRAGVWIQIMDSNKVCVGFLGHLSDYLDHMTNMTIPHQGTKGVWNSRIMGKVVNSSHRFVPS